MPLIEFRHMPGDDLKSEKGSKRTYTRTFVGRHSNPQASNLEVLLDSLVPQQLTFDPWDGGCLIVAANAKRRGRSLELWDISLTSTTEVEVSASNPLTAPPRWKAVTKRYEVPAIYDVKGNPILNTAGDLIEGAKRFVTGFQFTASVSVPDAPITWLDDFAEATNDRTMIIRGKPCPEQTVLFVGCEIGEPVYEFNVWHCPSTFTFEYNPLKWFFRPLNQGYRELRTIKIKGKNGVTNKASNLIEIRDPQGNPITKPMFLDRDGSQYRVIGSDGVTRLKAPLDQTDIITLEFQTAHSVDFNRLGIFR